MSGTTVCPICRRLYEGHDEHPLDPCLPCWRMGYRVDYWGNLSRVQPLDPQSAIEGRAASERTLRAFRAGLIGALIAACLFAWTSADASTTKRSTAAKNEFKRQHPCPANNQPRGPCPGYVIDHIEPLCAGGADRPENMQWQTVAEAKEKDKIEVAQCRRKK